MLALVWHCLVVFGAPASSLYCSLAELHHQLIIEYLYGVRNLAFGAGYRE